MLTVGEPNVRGRLGTFSENIAGLRPTVFDDRSVGVVTRTSVQRDSHGAVEAHIDHALIRARVGHRRHVGCPDKVLVLESRPDPVVGAAGRREFVLRQRRRQRTAPPINHGDAVVARRVCRSRNFWFIRRHDNVRDAITGLFAYVTRNRPIHRRGAGLEVLALRVLLELRERSARRNERFSPVRGGDLTGPLVRNEQGVTPVLVGLDQERPIRRGDQNARQRISVGIAQLAGNCRPHRYVGVRRAPGHRQSVRCAVRTGNRLSEPCHADRQRHCAQSATGERVTSHGVCAHSSLLDFPPEVPTVFAVGQWITRRIIRLRDNGQRVCSIIDVQAEVDAWRNMALELRRLRRDRVIILVGWPDAHDVIRRHQCDTSTRLIHRHHRAAVSPRRRVQFPLIREPRGEILVRQPVRLRRTTRTGNKRQGQPNYQNNFWRVSLATLHCCSHVASRLPPPPILPRLPQSNNRD